MEQRFSSRRAGAYPRGTGETLGPVESFSGSVPVAPEIPFCDGGPRRELPGPSLPSNTLVSPEHHPSLTVVSRSFQARFRLVSGSFEASASVLPTWRTAANPFPSVLPRPNSTRCYHSPRHRL